MKKLLGALFLNLVVSTSVFADTAIPWTKEGCESVKGTWITAHAATDSGCDANHCNGHNFCRSQVGMNWFSALIWCKAIGRQLANVETACPRGLASGGSCANLYSVSVRHADFWMEPKSYALINGGTSITQWGAMGGFVALCE